MPKREKTPEASDDEPRFLIINHAYPLHANLEVQEDIEALARWLGCIIPPQYLIAFHHKPSARNMIIVEIERTRPHEEWRRLLGAHKWSNFLVAPTQDEKDKVTRVYFCQYNSGRLVQKFGWKRIYVQDTWFMPEDVLSKNKFPQYQEGQWENMKRRANLIRIPYPLSDYCDVPTEDPTNNGLARPLPVEYFPREKKPQIAPAFVVGSDQWVDTKLKPASVWAKGQPNARKKSPAGPVSNALSSSEPRGRTMVRSGTVGVPLTPPGLPAPPGPSLPPGLTRSNNTTTTNNSSSSELDSLEVQTAAALRIDDEYCPPDIVSEGLEHIAGMNRAHDNQPPTTGGVTSLWEHAPAVEAEALLCRVKEQEKQKRDEQGKGKGRRGPPTNRGRNGAEAGNWPKYIVRGGSRRAGRGTGKGGGSGSGTANTVANADGSETVVPRNRGVHKAGGSNGASADQSNAWETASVGPW